jgi:hypothetical protein
MISERRFLLGDRKMTSSNPLAAMLVAAARHTLAEGRERIEHCVGQLTDEQLWWRPRPEMNSIANLLLHLSGNIRQWIVGGIGSAADVRNRPQEFADRSGRPKGEVLQQLQDTLTTADRTIASLSADDLVAHHRIQGFETNTTAALFDCISHFRGHVQEIINLTRMQLGERYKFYFVPQGTEQESAGGASA